MLLTSMLQAAHSFVEGLAHSMAQESATDIGSLPATIYAPFHAQLDRCLASPYTDFLDVGIISLSPTRCSIEEIHCLLHLQLVAHFLACGIDKTQAAGVLLSVLKCLIHVSLCEGGFRLDQLLLHWWRKCRNRALICFAGCTWLMAHG